MIPLPIERGLNLPPRVRTVLNISASDHGTTTAAILGGSRLKHISAARRQAIHTLRRMGFSFPEIGRFLGVHHTTCIYAVKHHAPRGDFAPVPQDNTIQYPDLSGEWAI